jgi:hypothetical protein
MALSYVCVCTAKLAASRFALFTTAQDNADERRAKNSVRHLIVPTVWRDYNELEQSTRNIPHEQPTAVNNAATER